MKLLLGFIHGELKGQGTHDQFLAKGGHLCRVTFYPYLFCEERYV
ncbi:hypothetical protein [Paenibacillus sp. TY11]